MPIAQLKPPFVKSSTMVMRMRSLFVGRKEMKAHGTKALLAIAVAGIFALTLGAQDEATYQTYMKTVAANFGPLRNAADNAAAKEPATTLADTFDKVAAFWKAHNAPDACNLRGKRARCDSSHRHRDRR